MNIIQKIYYYLIWRKVGLNNNIIKARLDMYRDVESYTLRKFN